ncbi:MAG TPA: diacylglycerol kinase [Allosphingosinicella sp.]|jgi:diacylglycerol kinase (ATP)|nr:diacylglycerol kinase [Allosphingosinicella sp.]
MHGTDPGGMKNRRFAARLGFAAAGLRIVFLREKSFRAQCAAALGAALLLLIARPGPLWSALVALSAGLVLALELANSALEYPLDHLHPGQSPEIGAAKDAAAAAVLLASAAAAAVGALMLVAILGRS